MSKLHKYRKVPVVGRDIGRFTALVSDLNHDSHLTSMVFYMHSHNLGIHIP